MLWATVHFQGPPKIKIVLFMKYLEGNETIPGWDKRLRVQHRTSFIELFYGTNRFHKCFKNLVKGFRDIGGIQYI